MSAPSRRALFGATALLATLPQFARAGGPDCELIGLCSSFVAGCEQLDTTFDTVEDDDEAERQGRRLLTLQADQVERMGELRATTADGIQARALALHRGARHGIHNAGHPGTTANRLLSYLLRDASALGGAL